MPQRSSARRYAEAAFQIAERDGTVVEWRSDLDTAVAALSEDEPMRVLANPAVPAADRRMLAERILGDGVSRGALNLVGLLLNRGRIDLLPALAAEFRRLHDQREGIIHATVTSAAPLDDAELSAVRERLANITGGIVEITTAVDPQILGGIVVRLGDRLIDGSVRGRLERLRNALAAGTLQAG